MKHTQGKWRKYSVNSGGNIQVTNGVIDVAAVYTPEWGYDAPTDAKEALANARLIAAAPDLLEAARAAQDAIENATDDLDRESPEYLTLCAVLVTLEQAINKAEGNQHG